MDVSLNTGYVDFIGNNPMKNTNIFNFNYLDNSGIMLNTHTALNLRACVIY